MINGNTALLHIGNFDTGKRTNLKRAVSEVGCIIIRNCNRITKRYIVNLIGCLKHILQRLTNTLSTTLILTIQASITHWL